MKRLLMISVAGLALGVGLFVVIDDVVKDAEGFISVRSYVEHARGNS